MTAGLLEKGAKLACLTLVTTLIPMSSFAEGPLVTVGPNGEAPTPASSVSLTEADVAAIREKGLTAALVMHEPSDWTAAAVSGAKDEFARLGIDVVAETDAGFSVERQKSDIETVLALGPDIVVALPVDSSVPTMFDPVVEAGAALAFFDNSPNGYVQGEDYVTIVSDDLVSMGAQAAHALADAIGEKGEIGYIFHDADFYITNSRDNAFLTTIARSYPDIEVVAQGGFDDPARGEDIAHGMLVQNPDLDGLYVAWAEPAQGALTTLRLNGNTKTKLVALDLSEPLALDMLKDGNTVALVADEAYQIGVTAARAAAGSVLGYEYEPYYVVNAVTFTKDNISEGWMVSLHMEAPKAVLDLAGK